MPKAQIFISHSCKDAEIDDGVALQDETDPRRKRLKFAREVRNAVVAGLAPACDVLLDRQLLDPGDRWRIKLLRWLGSCHGAVILLSEESIQSGWVLQEATIATWRKWLSDDFVLVPVLVGGLDPALLAKAGFGPMQITEFQAASLDSHADLSAASAAALAAQVVQRFAALDAATARGSEMQIWVDKVAAWLDHLPESALARTCKPLRIDEADWAHFPDHKTTVAHGLLHAGIEAAGDALEVLKGVMDVDRFARLAAIVLPTWVDAEAASALAAPRNAPRPWFAVNTDDPDTARDYAQRAYCCPDWWPNRFVHLDEAFGEGQADEALKRLTAVVARQQGVKDSSPPEVLPKLVKKNPFFVVFGPNLGPAQELQQLIAASPTLSTLTCLRLAGPAFEHVAAADVGLVRLLPALSEQARIDAEVGKLRIQNLNPS